MNLPATIHCYSLIALAWQPMPTTNPVHKTRQLIVATIGLVTIIALPVILIYYARKRWRP
ncbi:MAG: hypothetical protein ACJ8AJ_02905 [Gemmatimonadaceae bacterium]